MTTRVRGEMPGDRLPPARGPGWSVGVLGLIALMAYVSRLTIIDGASPSGYLGAHLHGEWVYPADAIRFWLTVMLIEGAAACLWLRARLELALAVRALILAGLFFVVLLGLGVLSMHAGTPIPEHLLWLLLATCWLFLFAIGSGLAGMILADRERERVLTRLERAARPRP
jgi:peptidoglycan/LPS O-acetylase OafA/YrhL